MAGNELAIEYMVLTELVSRYARREPLAERRAPRPQGPAAGIAHGAPRRLLHRLGDGLIAAGERFHGWSGAPAHARP